MGCHFLLQGIFPTQGSNPGLLHCRQISYQLSYGEKPLGGAANSRVWAEKALSTRPAQRQDTLHILTLCWNASSPPFVPAVS